MDPALVGNPGSVAGAEARPEQWGGHAKRKRSGQRNGTTRIRGSGPHNWEYDAVPGGKARLGHVHHPLPRNKHAGPASVGEVS